jgi:hypothetical protein
VGPLPPPDAARTTGSPVRRASRDRPRRPASTAAETLGRGDRRDHDDRLARETTIDDTRDFGLRSGLTNLPALRQIGFTANRRLLGVQRISHAQSATPTSSPTSPRRSSPTPAPAPPG